MIDEEVTFRKKGYYSTDLKPKSHKEVYAICEGEDCQREGGRGRWLQKNLYRDLCFLCSHRTKEFRKKVGGAEMGENNHNYGKRIPDKTRIKHSEIKKGENNPMYGKKHTDKSREKMSDALPKGEKHYNWKGGITHENHKFYCSYEYKQWIKYVFERDSYTCQECLRSGGIVLNAHHILPLRDYRDVEYSLNVDNGITLCEECHDKVSGKEYEFVERYQEIIAIRTFTHPKV